MVERMPTPDARKAVRKAFIETAREGIRAAKSGKEEEQAREINSLKGTLAELPKPGADMPEALQKFVEKDRAGLEEKIRSEESAPILPWGKKTGKARKESPERQEVLKTARAEAGKVQEKERVREESIANVEGLFSAFSGSDKENAVGRAFRKEFPVAWAQAARNWAAAYQKKSGEFGGRDNDLKKSALEVFEREAKTTGEKFGLKGETLDRFVKEQLSATATPERVQSLIGAYATGESDALSALEDTVKPEWAAKAYMRVSADPRAVQGALTHAFAAKRGLEQDVIHLKAVAAPRLAELFGKAFKGENGQLGYQDFSQRRDAADLLDNFPKLAQLSEEETADLTRLWDETASARSQENKGELFEKGVVEDVSRLTSAARERNELPHFPMADQVAKEELKMTRKEIARETESYQIVLGANLKGADEIHKRLKKDAEALVEIARSAADSRLTQKDQIAFAQKLRSYRNSRQTVISELDRRVPEPRDFRVNDQPFRHAIEKRKDFVKELETAPTVPDSDLIRNATRQLVSSVRDELGEIEKVLPHRVAQAQAMLQDGIANLRTEQTHALGPLLARKKELATTLEKEEEYTVKKLQAIFKDATETLKRQMAKGWTEQGEIQKAQETIAQDLAKAITEKDVLPKREPTWPWKKDDWKNNHGAADEKIRELKQKREEVATELQDLQSKQKVAALVIDRIRALEQVTYPEA